MISFANNFSKKFFNRKDSFELYVQKAQKKCREFKNNVEHGSEEDFEYSIELTKSELGLDDELIDSLLEDYVTQILLTLPEFYKILDSLRKSCKKGDEPDMQPLRDLAHKNLGVARNLRIKDAQKILATIMISNNLEKIAVYLEYLEACAISLKPSVAYKIYNLDKK